MGRSPRLSRSRPPRFSWRRPGRRGSRPESERPCSAAGEPEEGFGGLELVQDIVPGADAAGVGVDGVDQGDELRVGVAGAGGPGRLDGGDELLGLSLELRRGNGIFEAWEVGRCRLVVWGRGRSGG